MTVDRTNPRNPAHEVDTLFVDRWSPRSFVTEELAGSLVDALLEAARWAPSCMNEQPWLFWVARSKESRGRFISTLTERNQVWAKNASLFLYIGARKYFGDSNNPNRHALFDAGAAWMSLTLQARRLGLHAHGMAGFDRDRAYALTGANPDRSDIIAAIAVGRRGSAEELPEDIRKREAPTPRNEVETFTVEL
ncbi:MAG: nitroreductase family protein [Chitinispirillaceae bacterium]|nr:nitroreductase family protein [Chitinispirillaceae bacterium]